MNKTIVITAGIIILTVGFFWAQSRYPALDEKATKYTAIEDVLSFEAFLPVKDSDPFYKNIIFSTINWTYTNKEGMTFGIVLATAFLTLLGYLHRHGRGNAFISVFKGALIGAPLGVCVNCAAPVARGMYKAGSSMGSSLAVMFSSPTLNIIVLTMLFSLFPFYISIIKIALTLFLILIILPILSRYVFKSEDTLGGSEMYKCRQCQHKGSNNKTWLEALNETGKDFLKNFYYIVRTVVPLMILAGFLGVLIVTFFPLENLIDFEINAITMFVAALVGTFLPIPMAFDVVAVHALMQAGLKPGFSMVLLLTLGTYSIYPLFIISKTISRRVAVTLFVTVMALGIGGGYAAQAYDDYRADKIMRFFDLNIGLERNSETPSSVIEKDAVDHIEEAISLQTELYYSSEYIMVESINYQGRNFLGAKPFTRYEGSDLGLDKHNDFSILELSGPFWLGRGIASGDFNNDYWQDIALATNSGILLYKNLGTSTFVLETFDVPEINNLGIHVVAFIDIDNDGWQDIYVTSYGGKNYFILNDKKGFKSSRVIEIPNEGAVLTEASSFADIDKDGDLDFVNGNWFYGQGRPLPSKRGAEANKIITNDNLQFKEKNLEEIIGETLSVLFSDFNNDGNPDLVVGNDFDEPDIFYTGYAGGILKQILRADNIIPRSAGATMSVDVADFNNDLYMDIYMAAISSSENTIEKNPCFEIQNKEDIKMCEEMFRIKRIINQKDIAQCGFLQDDRSKKDCMVMIMGRLARNQNDETLCEKIPESYEIQRLQCRNYFVSVIEESDYEELIESIHGNVLLEGSGHGVFQDVSEEKAVSEGLWSWNAKFADLDNDEWQDIYIATGFFRDELVQSNIFFHNYGGERFRSEQEEFGLVDYNATGAYTYIDIDNDGDLDIITVPVIGPLNVYVNNEYQNNSISFEFKDNKGNYFGIGNKVYIYYGEDSQRHQVREIKSGGGFLSFDSPIAHFGLEKYEKVNKIEIAWSTGERTTINKEFLANKKYIIRRNL